MSWRACTRMGDKINARSILVGKTEGKKPVVRHSSRWEDRVKFCLTETGLVECGSG